MCSRGRPLTEADFCSSITSTRREYEYKISLASASIISDRKSTRLNSSHLGISYAVFCLKKKKKTKIKFPTRHEEIQRSISTCINNDKIILLAEQYITIKLNVRNKPSVATPVHD